MQTHGPLIELARIVDAVHRIRGIDGAGMGRIHFHRVGGYQPADTFFNILRNQVVILNQKTACGYGHPAILIAVIMH